MRGDLAMGYWQSEHPILLESLAAQLPDTTPDFVAELLVDMEKDVSIPVTDSTMIFRYLDLIAVPEEHHGKHEHSA